MPDLPVQIDHARLADFCRRWKVAQLSLFGSVLRDDFRPDSDIDVLVTFSPDERWSLLDIAAMRTELMAMFGRPVDLLEKRAIKNPFRRHRILTTARLLYAA